MPRFSKYFGLNSSQAQLDFVDVNNEKDTPVYIDPFAIEMREDEWSGRCSEKIRTFFLELLDALRSDKMQRAKYLVGQLHEPRETYLGISIGIPNGKGVGAKQATQLIHAILRSEAFKTGRLSDLSEMALYVEGIDRDKISDLTTNIIRKQLVKYTRQQCELLGIECQPYIGPPMWDAYKKQWISSEVYLPYMDNDPVLLVPKVIVRRGLSLSADDFYRNQITDFFRAEHLAAHSSLVEVVKGKPKLTKEKVRQAHPKSKNMIAETVQKHPELLDLYKKIAAERGELVTVNPDDLSVGAVCLKLAAKLSTIPTGPKHATEYQNIAQGIITTIFYPHLIMPTKEWEINEGRKRIDIVYTNDAKSGFLQQRRDATNTAATMLIVECKNYSKDIANNEIDQLLGRFDNNRGRLGWMLCRSVDDQDRLLQRCRDLASRGIAFIMTVTDEDLLKWLDLKGAMQDQLLEEDLHLKFRKLIS